MRQFMYEEEIAGGPMKAEQAARCRGDGDDLILNKFPT